MLESGCIGCCVYPHGWLSILATVMALVSFGLSIGVHGTCFFVTATDEFSTGFGIWTKENTVRTSLDDYRCEEYDFSESLQFDRKWNSAAGLAYTAGVIGFIFTVLIIGTSCAGFIPAFFKVSAVFFILAGIFDFCTLVGLDSTICSTLTLGNTVGGAHECTFSTGAGLAVGAGISYFITAAIIFFIPPPRKPDGDDSGDNVSSDSSSDDSSESGVAKNGFWLTLWSNILFLIGSVLFLYLSVSDLQWAKDFNSFQDAIGWGRDSWSWREYADTYTDDYVFQTRFHWVSSYQIISFFAAAMFMIEGFYDFFRTPGTRGLFFIFAGTFGLVSSWLQERVGNMSTIFNLMSAHLYVLEAIGLLINRDDFTGRLKRWVRFNDACFVIATTIDVVLSYFPLFNLYNVKVAKAETAAASLWLFCACFYIGAILYAKYRGYFDGDDDVSVGAPKEEDELGGEEKAVSDEGKIESPNESSLSAKDGAV